MDFFHRQNKENDQRDSREYKNNMYSLCVPENFRMTEKNV